MANQQKLIEQHKSHINKCIDVVKKLLKEKSNIEKKEARQKCMQNRLRLGQFVTQRVGATFQENWTDGYAFHELARRQEEIATEREEIDKQKKLLLKKRPSNSETGRKRSQPQPSLHNGTEATFLKPDAVPGSYTWQEYYEADEILKVHHDAPRSYSFLKISRHFHFFQACDNVSVYVSTVKTKRVEERRRGSTIRNGKARKRAEPTHQRIEAYSQRGPIEIQLSSCFE